MQLGSVFRAEISELEEAPMHFPRWWQAAIVATALSWAVSAQEPGVPEVQAPTPFPSALPSNPTTNNLSAPAAPAGTVVSGPVPLQTTGPTRRAEIRYSCGLLTVDAKNSSLNGILREIGRQTGMKITGGVQEDRVFGVYGPGAPAEILATLLDGTGSNMLLVQSLDQAPTELILSPRHGGVTPPDPNAGQGQDEDAQAPAYTEPPNRPEAARRFPQPGLPQRLPEGLPPGNAPQGNAQGTQGNSTDQVVFPPINATTPAATGTTSNDTPQGSDTTKTPQQIFDQLQRLRQQQQQGTSTTPK